MKKSPHNRQRGTDSLQRFLQTAEEITPVDDGCGVMTSVDTLEGLFLLLTNRTHGRTAMK
jgi:hypothetical protein